MIDGATICRAEGWFPIRKVSQGCPRPRARRSLKSDHLTWEILFFKLNICKQKSNMTIDQQTGRTQIWPTDRSDPKQKLNTFVPPFFAPSREPSMRMRMIYLIFWGEYVFSGLCNTFFSPRPRDYQIIFSGLWNYFSGLSNDFSGFSNNFWSTCPTTPSMVRTTARSRVAKLAG